MAKHFHSGAGMHGCLYQDGPHYHATYQEAVDSLAETYNLSKGRKADLKRDSYLELNLRRDGNEYCEVTECGDACKPEDCEG